MKLRGKRFVVLVEDHYEDQELWYPVRRLQEEGAQVTLVGPEKGAEYSSKYGYPARAQATAPEISTNEMDGVIIPGGYAPDRMRRHAEMVNLVREAAGAKKIVASICHGGWMLCSARVLKGRTVTSFSAIRDDMSNAGAEWVDLEVVQDDNLITSRQPDDLPAFMRTIIKAAAG